jgi:hypothetical protein
MKFWKYFRIGKRILSLMMELHLDNSCDKCLFLHEGRKCLLYDFDMQDYFLLYGFPRERLKICKKEVGQ